MKEEGRELFKKIIMESIACGDIDLDCLHTSFMEVLGKFKEAGGKRFLKEKLSKEKDQILTKIFRDVLEGLGIKIKDERFIRRTEPKKIKESIAPEILEGAKRADFQHHRRLGSDY